MQPRAMGESMANPPRFQGDRVGVHPMPNVEHEVFHSHAELFLGEVCRIPGGPRACHSVNTIGGF